MIPDPNRKADITIDGDNISYADVDGRRHVIGISELRLVEAAWEALDQAWVHATWEPVTERHEALAARLESAGWWCQGAGGGKSDYLPPAAREDDDFDGPMFCIPHRPYPGWEDDMARLERKADEWIATHTEATP